MRFLTRDHWGMVNSALCLVHCLAMPLLVSFGASFAAHPLVELLFVIWAAWALRSALAGRPIGTFELVLWTVWAVFAVSLYLEHEVEWAGYVSMSASVGLIVGHALNLRRGREHEAVCCDGMVAR